MARSGNKGTKNRNQERQESKGMPGGPELRSSMDDSASDEERLKQETSFVLIPDVKDIPGQENFSNAGFPGALGDVTASSDDEEGVRDGKDILGEEDELEIVMGTEADVTREDLILLGDPDQDMDLGEDELNTNAGLDETDLEGDRLNEAGRAVASTGEDLDIPDADEDNPENTAAGQGDEENNYYSLGSGDKDNLTEGRP